MTDPGQTLTWGAAAMLLIAAVLWPLLKTSFSRLLSQNDQQNQRVEKRLEDFLTQVSMQFKDVATEIRGLARSLDKHDARADLADARISDGQSKHNELVSRVSSLETKFDHLHGRFTSVMQEWKMEKMGGK